MRDQLPRSLRFLEILEDHDHRPPAESKREVSERMTEVGLHEIGLDRIQGFGDPAQLRAAALWLDEVRDAVVEGHETDAVAVCLGDPREHERRVDAVLHLLELSAPRRPPAPAL